MMVRRVCRRSVTALTAMILVVFLFAMGTPAQDRNPPARQFPDIQLQSPARGGAALSALAPYLPQLATSYGKSEDELRNIFLRDNTVWTDTRGRLFYGCEFGPPPVSAPGAENAGAVLQAPYPDDQTFLLHSRPSATKVIYLDFDGQTTSGTAWNGGATIVSAPFDLDGIPSSFNTTERERIQYIWQRVAEDYAPFDVDVTTEDPGVDKLRRTSSGDVYFGMRVVISPTNWYNPKAGGVAYVGVFDWISSTDVYGTCWVFTQQLGPNGEKAIAEAASHEAGHTLGLSHDGVTGGSAYYSGHGNWAPIMGVGYYEEVTQWSKGEYSGANNTEDDLAIIPTYGVPYRADDHGNFIGTATPLTGTSVSASGIIETRNDVDMFSFQTGAGSISFTVNPAPRSPNLDIYVVLYNGTGNLVASNNGSGLSASFTTTVTAGTYYLAIDGVGTGDPSTGYSDYDSLGQYQITGTVVTPPGTKSPVASASASPTSGTAPLVVKFSSAGSSDSDGTIQTYHWDFNDGASSSSANPAHTYGIGGTYTATLVVTDNVGLSSSDTVTITVANPPPTTPANVKATAASATQVNLTWTASTSPIGISRYEIERSYNNGAYALIGTSTTAGFANSSVSPGITYLYRVRAVDTQNDRSPYSNRDLATTIVFTDDPLVSGLTQVRAVHFSEMRQAVNAVRKSAGLAAATWTNSNLAGILLKAVHVQEMRNSLNPALASLGFSTPSYTDSTLTTGVTRIRKVHLDELRQRVK